jgi:integrase/recombinase XerD
MKASIALKIFREYQRSNLRPGTVIGYRHLLENFEVLFGERELKSIRSEDLFHFLGITAEKNQKPTKRHRHAQLKAFFNFIITNNDQSLTNPLDAPLLRKTFRPPKETQRQMISKESIDEVIFNSRSLRDRLLLELQGR